MKFLLQLKNFTLGNLSTEKLAEVHMIPPKLVKLTQKTWMDLSHSQLTKDCSTINSQLTIV